MIESILISNVASYMNTTENLNDLSKINFFFGSNSSGKTTISRIIANEDDYPTCNVNWKNNVKLDKFVYNQDFIEKNFSQSNEIKGIFTLGENSVESQKKIDTEKRKLDLLTNEVSSLKQALGNVETKSGKLGELLKNEEIFEKKCWKLKKEYDNIFKNAFKGFRDSQKRYKTKIIDESKINAADLIAFDELEIRAKTVFDHNIVLEELIPTIDGSNFFFKHEANVILKKRILGKNDVDIAGLIELFDNSDWVKQGRLYYDVQRRICPFCQQETSKLFADSLNSFFDSSYENDMKKIDTLAIEYKSDTISFLNNLNEITESFSKFIDEKALNFKKEVLENIFNRNYLKIEEKKKEPSHIIELESSSKIIFDIDYLIKTANTKINSHNEIFKNLEYEKEKLTSQIWKYLIEEELKEDIIEYNNNKSKLEKTIQNITEKINCKESDIRNKNYQISEYEKEITSLIPTKDNINNLLSSFGFQTFSLNIIDNGKYYRLIRQDGSDAAETLSEGEKSFLTFLYFFHLLKGGFSGNIISSSRIVVFDDPVSSLDSDVLFIVSSLIKSLFDELRKRTGLIQQIFIMTHNVYFHKEVTFNRNRQDRALNDETFYIIRRDITGSKIKKYDSNPIKTSYELLWEDIRDPVNCKFTIQNTMRRILENYFIIMGGMDYEGLIDRFEGRDKILCKSLTSWVHDGSHYALDDLYISMDSSMIDSYLKIFKKIFEENGHSDHYNMMMGL